MSIDYSQIRGKNFAIKVKTNGGKFEDLSPELKAILAPPTVDTSEKRLPEGPQ
jgi:hypothetical protein